MMGLPSQSSPLVTGVALVRVGRALFFFEITFLVMRAGTTRRSPTLGELIQSLTKVEQCVDGIG